MAKDLAEATASRTSTNVPTSASAPPSAAKTTRLNVNISEDTAQALRELALRSGTSVTNVVRRAVGVYKFLDDEMGSKDRTLQIVDKAHNQITTIAIV